MLSASYCRKKAGKSRAAIIAAIPFLALVLLLMAGCGGNEGQRLQPQESISTGRIGVMMGTIGERIAAKRFPQARIMRFDDVMDAVIALENSHIEGIVTADFTAERVVRKNPSLTLMPGRLSAEESCVATHKGEAALHGAINAILTRLRDEGTLGALEEHWFHGGPIPEAITSLTPPPSGAEPLQVGVTATREPVSYIDSTGHVAGFDTDLARLIGKHLGRPVTFENMKFMSLIPALQSRKIDVIISGMSATDERRRSVDFSIPYFHSGQALMVRKAATPPPEGGKNASGTTSVLPPADTPIPDMNGRRIGILTGTIFEHYAATHWPKATIKHYRTPSDMILAVQSRTVDAGVYTSDELVAILREHGELELFGPSLMPIPLCMGFRKSSDSLRLAFDRFLARLREEGRMEEMERYWMSEGMERMPKGLPVTGKEAPPLRIGILSDNGLPFTIVADGRLVGFNIELLERFAAASARKPVCLDLEFGSLIAALESHRIDMIGAPMSRTAERQRQISFSAPYHIQGSYLFRLRQDATTKEEGFVDTLKESFTSNILRENRWKLLADGFRTTLTIALFSVLLGTLMGAGVAAMRMAPAAPLRLPAKLFISLMRGIPVLVLLMLVFYVVFASVDISPVTVAVIAFAMHFGAYAAEIFRSGIESIDRGQREAGISMGFTPLATFFFIVLPQAIRRILPVYKGEVISLVKMTSVVGYIAVQDLTKASDIIRSRTFDAFFPLVMVAALYFLIAWLFALALDTIGRQAFPGRERP